MAIELEGLEFELEASSNDASKTILDLASSLNRLKTASKTGLTSLSTVAEGVDKLSESIGKINTGKFRQLTELLNGLRDLQGVRIPATVTNGIGRLAENIGRIRKQDIERLRDLTSALRELGEVSDVRVPSLRGLNRAGSDGDNTAPSTDSDIPTREFEDVIVTAQGGLPTLSDLSLALLRVRVVLGRIAAPMRLLGGGLNLVGAAARTAANGLGLILSHIGSDMAAKVKAYTSSFGKLFASVKRIAMYRALRAFFSTLTKALKEGIGNLYQYSNALGGTFAGSMDRLATSSLYLKNSLAAMASPIINALAPAVEYLIDRFVALINIVNQFFAMLSGASTYTAAKKVATGYKDAAGAASGAAKELKKSILAFDEINALANNNSGGGGGGSGGADYSSMFEELPVENAIGDFAKRLKDAFLSGDWETLGRTIGDKLNTIVDGINFGGIGDKLGYGLNGAVQSVYYLLDETDFVNIGKRLAEFTNHAFDQIDTEYVGRLYIKKFTIALDTLGGYLGNLDWQSLASKVGSFLKGIFDEASEWISRVNWGKVGTTVYNALKGALNGLDFGGIAKSFFTLLGNALNGAVTGLISIIYNCVVDIGKYFNEFITDDYGAKKSGKAYLMGILNGIWDAIKNIGNAAWEYVVKPFLDALSKGFDSAASYFEDIGASAFGDFLRGFTGKRKQGWIEEIVSDKLGLSSQAKPYEIQANVSLIRKGWETLPKFVGDLDPFKVYLEKGNYDTPDSFVGELKPKAFSLYRANFTSGDSFVGEVKPRAVVLYAGNYKYSVDDFVGVVREKALNLRKGNYSSLDDFVGFITPRLVNLAKGNYKSLNDFVGSKVEVAVSLFKSGWTTIKGFLGLDTGGIIDDRRLMRLAANGGIFGANGAFGKIPAYAGGTANAHGTMFVAGERGAEIVGNINGHSEVLNKSQLASVMYSSITAGIKLLLPYLTGMTNTVAYSLSAVNATVADLNRRTVAKPGTELRYSDVSSLLQTKVSTQDEQSISEGVRSGVSEGNLRQVELLREQNDLLRQLIAKETDIEITTDSIVGATRRKNQRDGRDMIPVDD